jgi:glycosyltransferase involved in cell wall biosynthesis
MPHAGRVGIYNDDVYRISGEGPHRQLSADRAFLLFACEVGSMFEGVTLLGRAVRSDGPGDYPLPNGVDFFELPAYASLTRVRQVAAALAGTVRGFWRALSSLDIVWVFGPHPLGFILILLAALRRRRVVLGVRGDPLRYYTARLPSRRWRPVLVVVRMMDGTHRLLSRRLRTTIVGSEIARQYRAAPRLHVMTVSLVRATEVAVSPPDRDYSAGIGLLSVGRLELEKNPFLLVDALAELERRAPGRYRLLWIGRGNLEAAVRDRLEELGLMHRIELRGYVPFGPELLELYRSSHIFVHVSLTEGVPQVIVEALACGTPVVATEVGGVSGAVAGGAAGLLVPPANLEALVDAVERMAADAALRQRLVARGLELARETTFEAEAERVATFIAT